MEVSPSVALESWQTRDILQKKLHNQLLSFRMSNFWSHTSFEILKNHSIELEGIWLYRAVSGEWIAENEH